MNFEDGKLFSRFSDLKFRLNKKFSHYDYGGGLKARTMTAVKRLKMHDLDCRGIAGISYVLGELGVCLIEPDPNPIWKFEVHRVETPHWKSREGLPEFFRSTFEGLGIACTVATLNDNFSATSPHVPLMPFTGGVIASELRHLWNLGVSFVSPDLIKKRVIGDAEYVYRDQAVAALATALYGVAQYLEL